MARKKKRKVRSYPVHPNSLKNLEPYIGSGFPPKPKVYINHVGLNVTPYQKAQLTYNAKLQGLTPSELIREFIDSLDKLPDVMFE